MWVLHSLTAVGMKDQRKHSVLQSGYSSLQVKELLRASSHAVSCKAWRLLSVMDISLANILLSPTSSI